MPTSSPQPLIFLAFANDQSDYLYNLQVERDQIRQALQPAVDQGLCELIIEPSATISTILDVFQQHRDRIAIFHYGGHANAYLMLLEDERGERSIAHTGGLSSFLGEQRQLQMVFFNGCSSESQARELSEAGVPVVVGTTQPISDSVAMRLSQLFYQYLAQGLPLASAWEKASEAVQSVKAEEGYRLLDFGEEGAVAEMETSVFPWKLHLRAGSDQALAWNLPEAARQPLFDLPLPRGYFERLPVDPYKALHYFQREDAAVFFGRGAQIRELYQKLQQPEPVILFYGKSGAGKSSLLDAGLLPRLEGQWEPLYQRRQPSEGLALTLQQTLQAKAEALGLPQAAALGQTWRAIEAQTGRPLLFILDQAEECFTRPLPQAGAAELQALLALLDELFAAGEDRPYGKLVLAYRKEYHPEIKRAFQAARMATEELFLQHLDREGIIEVVEGLNRQPETREAYQLQIRPEPGGSLAEIVADDLLEDRDAPIAAMLQILLTKMWREAKQHNSAQPTFSVELYQGLKRQGLAMGEFLDQQMEKLSAWQSEVVESGLVLDVLYFHTTDLGTAGTRSLEEIRAQYQSRQEQVDELIVKGKELYLLSTPRDDTQKTSLAHDTLAPLVIDRFNHSDLPGQRALRVLSNKLKDFEVGHEKTYLDAADLATLEAGLQGMRQLRERAQDLLAASRKLQAKRQRAKRRNRVAALVLTAFIAVLGMVALRQYHSVQAAELNTIDRMIRTSWKAGLYLERNEDFVEGVRDLYEGIKPIMDLVKLRELAPVAIFERSPHGETPNYDSPTDFTYYNEDFVIWLREYGIPGAKDEAFRESTQPVYDEYLRDMARSYYRAYLYLRHHPDRQAFEREYRQMTTERVDPEQIEYVSNRYNPSWPGELQRRNPVNYIHWRFSGFAQQFDRSPVYGQTGGYLTDVACGFWLRRHIDGTAEEFFDLLLLLLQAYDPGYLALQR